MTPYPHSVRATVYCGPGKWSWVKEGQMNVEELDAAERLLRQLLRLWGEGSVRVERARRLAGR